jgi:TonB family protein
MNRLQKKCVIATAGFHLLLLVILFVGPAFFNAKPKVDDSQIINCYSPNAVEAALNSGVKAVQPPAPTPIVTPPPQPIPPAPMVQPAPVPTPTIVERLEKIFKPEPVKPTPAPTENQTQPKKISLVPVTRTVPKISTPAKATDNSQALNSALQHLKSQLSSATDITVPGNNSGASSDYRAALATIYYNAWTTPDDTANDDANAIVKITVASDGTVISARIITPSGDAKTDESIRRALDRVSSVPPLQDKSKTQQDFTFAFNLKTKRLLE